MGSCRFSLTPLVVSGRPRSGTCCCGAAWPGTGVCRCWATGWPSGQAAPWRGKSHNNLTAGKGNHHQELPYALFPVSPKHNPFPEGCVMIAWIWHGNSREILRVLDLDLGCPTGDHWCSSDVLNWSLDFWDFGSNLPVRWSWQRWRKMEMPFNLLIWTCGVTASLCCRSSAMARTKSVSLISWSVVLRWNVVWNAWN